MRKLVEERTGASPDNKFYRINPKVDDIPDAYGKVCNGVKLLVLGTVETGGGGCVCPEHVMLGSALSIIWFFTAEMWLFWIWKPAWSIWAGEPQKEWISLSW